MSGVWRELETTHVETVIDQGSNFVFYIYEVRKPVKSLTLSIFLRDLSLAARGASQRAINAGRRWQP